MHGTIVKKANSKLERHEMTSEDLETSPGKRGQISLVETGLSLPTSMLQ